MPGNREYNPGWHTALDLKHLLTVSEASRCRRIERKESRGGHFRDDFPNKDDEAAKFNLVMPRRRTAHEAAPRTDSADAGEN